MNTVNMGITQAAMEIFGGFICLMLAIIIMINGNARDSWKLLKKMLFLISFAFFFEACAYMFRGDTATLNIYMTRISNFGVFFMNIMLTYIFIKYMYKLFEEKGIRPHKVYKIMVDICIALNLIILVANLFTKWMYYFDDKNYYHRNTWWYVYTALCIVCILVCTFMSFRYRKSITRLLFLALLCYTFTPIVAIIVQTFVYGISVTNIGLFIAMLIMLAAYLREWSSVRERTYKERKSLEIIVLFVIMIISMGASVVSCIISIKKLSLSNSENNSMMIAHMVSDGIENEFLKPIVVAETMSNDYSLMQYIKRSGKEAPEVVEDDVAAYLDSIRNGFGYQMVFAVCDKSRAYYTYNGITKYIDIENDTHDIWYKWFLEEGKHYDLDVDTDEANHWELSVFINNELVDENGEMIGVCGVGVEMTSLQNLLVKYEKKYDIKIDLIDKDGLIQVDSDATRIEKDYLDNSYFDKVDAADFLYEQMGKTSRMTKYMKDLDWYLVVEDKNPDKISVFSMTISAIIIFVIGIIMMGIVFFVIYIRDRKASKEIIERRKMSLVDELTGLYNRRAYEEDCKLILNENSVSDIIMVMMDVNGLKYVNDNFGHLAGDELIIGAADSIRTSMGKLGKIYRIGGDEFVAILRCSKDTLIDAINTFEHLQEIWSGSHECELSISKGYVIGNEHEEMTITDMKELADKLMYKDKEECYRQKGKIRRKS